MNKKIGFVLLSGRENPIPSTRIAVLNMIPYLHEAGYETHILFEPQTATESPELPDLVSRAVHLGIDIVYFQKVRGRSVIDTVTRLATHGIKTVYGVCDLIENDMAAATDATVVVTDYLRSLYDNRLHDKIHVVHDGIENPDIRVDQYRYDNGSRRNPLKAVLVTSAELFTIPIFDRMPPCIQLNIIGRYKHYHPLYSLRRKYWGYLEQPDLSQKAKYLCNIFRRDFKKTNWDIDTVNSIMAASDIGIIPVDTVPDPLPNHSVSRWQVKSENRLTMKMAMGLPVIASPVPSYENVIVQGKNGYLANSRDEWIAYFNELRDPQRRRAMGRRARESVIHRYSKEEQARRLIGVFHNLISPAEIANRVHINRITV